MIFYFFKFFACSIEKLWLEDMNLFWLRVIINLTTVTGG